MNKKDDLVIERTFSAPIKTVWEMWTVAEKFQQWYGPDGGTIPVANMDVRVGGKRHICMEMQTPNGPYKAWFVGEYLVIDPVTHLEYTEVLSNEAGEQLAPSALGMPGGDEPNITTLVLDLEDIDGKSTRMKMQHKGIPADSRGAAGWQMAINKLEKLL